MGSSEADTPAMSGGKLEEERSVSAEAALGAVSPD
tara:strand:+ start:14692 stop:14796 length:105 start_codon:yes stop_codon:yes gene_type:complete